MNPLELPAGRELDALIAEKVMGSPRHHWYEGYRGGILYEIEMCANCNVSRENFNGEKIGEDEICVKPYSSQIESAWAVVEKVNSLIASWRTKEHGYAQHRFEIYRDSEGWVAGLSCYKAHAETAPLAICRGALKAVL